MIATESETLTLAKQLISRQSVTPDDGGCQQHIAALLTASGFHCEHLRFENVDNLWARFGKEEPLFVFAGHTDVVPTGPLDAWTHPPFQATIHDGKLYGRGASDMKCAIASMVIAAKDFVRENADFKGSIAFLLTSDEEGPSLHGTKKVIEVLQQRDEKISYCVIGEPSSINQLGDQIRVGRRGSLHGKLIVRGKQGHVAHPHLAINPIHLSLLALHQLTKEVWDEGNSDFPPTTFQITNVHAGTGAANVIPGHIEIDFNFRFSTAITMTELKNRAEQILKHHHLSFDINWTVGALPFLPCRGKLLASTQDAIKTLTGLDTILSTGGGTSDGRFIAPTGAELLELGLSHATAHHIDEHVSVSDLDVLTDIYSSILKNLFK